MVSFIKSPPPPVYYDLSDTPAGSNLQLVDAANGDDNNPPRHPTLALKTLDKAMWYVSHGRTGDKLLSWYISLAPGTYTLTRKPYFDIELVSGTDYGFFSRDGDASEVIINTTAMMSIIASQVALTNVTFNLSLSSDGNWHPFQVARGGMLVINDCVINVPSDAHDTISSALGYGGGFINIYNMTVNYDVGSPAIRSLFRLDDGAIAYLGGTIVLNNCGGYYEAFATLQDRAFLWIDPNINLTANNTITGKKFDLGNGSTLLVGDGTGGVLLGTAAGTSDASSTIGVSV